jgi:hypothetical protein
MGCALQFDGLLGGGQPGVLSASLGALRRGVLLLALLLSGDLLPRRLGPDVGLLLVPVGLGGVLTLLPGHLILQPLALDLGPMVLLAQLGLLLAIPRLGPLGAGLGLGVGLGVLETALPGEILPAGGPPSHLFQLPGHLAHKAAGGAFGTRSVRQLQISFFRFSLFLAYPTRR